MSLTIYIDGWSARMLEGADLYAATADKNVLSVRFHPASLEDLGLMLEHHPDWVAAWGGRMISTDLDWNCTPGGCETAAQNLSLTQLQTYLTSPGSIPAYGPSYQEWEVDAGVLKATLDIPKGSEGVNLFGVPAGSEDLTEIIWDSRTHVLDIESIPLYDMPSQEASADKAVFVSAGLGRIFAPTPAWVTEGSAFNPTLFYGIPSEDEPLISPDDVANKDPLLADAAARGLAHTSASQLLRYLSANELTYLTSPTIGCAPWVLCVPADLDTEVELHRTETIGVCIAEDMRFPSGDGPSVAEETFGVFTDETVTVTLPAPIHQNGVWGGVRPAEFTPPTNPDTQLLSSPPLASGEVQLHRGSVKVYAASYSGELPALWFQLGLVVEVGAEQDKEFTAAEIVGLSGTALRICNPST